MISCSEGIDLNSLVGVQASPELSKVTEKTRVSGPLKSSENVQQDKSLQRQDDTDSQGTTESNARAVEVERTGPGGNLLAGNSPNHAIQQEME